MNREQSRSYREQVFWVLVIEALIIAVLILVATMFWTHVCTDSLKSCVAANDHLRPVTFLALSAFRPFVFTPFFFMALIAGPAFGAAWGTVLTLVGGLLSALAIATIGRAAGRNLVAPWMNANLPATSRFLRQQDYKIAFFLWLVPLIPFDITAFFCGVFGCRWRHLIWTMMLGTLPEALVFARMGSPEATFTGSAIDTLALVAVAVIMPLLLGEYLSRRNGRSMWQQSILAYKELLAEVRNNNKVPRRTNFHPDRTPILLLYGFFSSRRALGILEKHLQDKGFDVISFNLGGLMGTFFTRSILDSSLFIDGKLKRQMERHGFKKVHIVAHSKGGLVALWWLLKMGGHQYCDKVVTLGTPFKGSNLTWLALVTPLGLWWQDMWEMRPGSTFLKNLHLSTLPDNVDVYCFHSDKDRVARGATGLFQPIPPSRRIHPVAMNDISHFEFLSRRQVTDRIASLLGVQVGVVEVKAAETTGENALLRQR